MTPAHRRSEIPNLLELRAKYFDPDLKRVLTRGTRIQDPENPMPDPFKIFRPSILTGTSSVEPS